MDISITTNLVTLANSWPGYIDRVAIVDHIQDGNMLGSWSRFNNPAEQVSAHFGVALTGRVELWVDTGRSAWANGILEPGWDTSIPWLAECASKGINPNRRTISIEHEGVPGEPLSDAQYQATLKLHIYLIKRYPSILPDRKHIIGHYQITPHSRGNCPGPYFPFGDLIPEIRKVVPMPLPDFGPVPGRFNVRPEFNQFWYSKGGLAIFGYPIAPEMTVTDGKYGVATVVQYFERARFELQPDNSVMLGLVGVEAMQLRGK